MSKPSSSLLQTRKGQMCFFTGSLRVTTQACNPAAWSLSYGTQQTLLPPLPSCQNPGNVDTPKIFYNCSKLISQIIIKQNNPGNQKGTTRKRKGQREGGWGGIFQCPIQACVKCNTSYINYLQQK